MQIEKSKELKHLLQVYAQETTFGHKKSDYCRLELVAQGHLEQNIKGSHFKARNRDEDRPAIGAPSKGKAKGKGKENAKNNSERGDCIRWTTKGKAQQNLLMKRKIRIDCYSRSIHNCCIILHALRSPGLAGLQIFWASGPLEKIKKIQKMKKSKIEKIKQKQTTQKRK